MALRLAGVVLETAPELGLGTMEHAAPREPSVLGTAPSSAFEHAGPRESSADELGVAGAQPLTPSPMHSRTLAQPFLCPLRPCPCLSLSPLLTGSKCGR